MNPTTASKILATTSTSPWSLEILLRQAPDASRARMPLAPLFSTTSRQSCGESITCREQSAFEWTWAISRQASAATACGVGARGK
ncbi:hypothetical protein RUND412_004782 [Rhizina undulata]